MNTYRNAQQVLLDMVTVIATTAARAARAAHRQAASLRKKVAARRARARSKVRWAGRRTLSWARRCRTGLLNTGGFGFLAAAAWVTFGVGAGLAAVGLSALALEVLFQGQQ